MKSATVNFTASVERDLLRRAKVIAAKHDTSVNALFSNELRYLVETFEAAESTGIHNYQALVNFSLGKAEDIATMEVLGLDNEEDLFLLMAKAHLPMPRLSPDRTAKMVADLNDLLN
ncbi:hypothetical protein [Leucothrix mucor]|jgi:hypothetical protein|uniref:hypothetical protein n=1 Tax=Leucothrix mucor TaxID=45248 RepID=UPI0003B3F643|nr:hypothetical protein [Leucothrix mucor]